MPHPTHLVHTPGPHLHAPPLHTPGPHLLSELLNHQELVVALSAVHSKECRCKRIHASISYMGSAPPAPPPLHHHCGADAPPDLSVRSIRAVLLVQVHLHVFGFGAAHLKGAGRASWCRTVHGGRPLDGCHACKCTLHSEVSTHCSHYLLSGWVQVHDPP